MKKKIIRLKINEVEKLLEQPITIINYDFYKKLLEIHNDLWSMLYFEVNSKENFLIPK